MTVLPDEIGIPLSSGIPASVLHKGVVAAQVHSQWRSAHRAMGNQFCGNLHIPLPGDHLTNQQLIVIGAVVAGFGTLPQAIIALGVELPLFVKTRPLKLMIHIGGQHEIVLALHQ